MSGCCCSGSPCVAQLVPLEPEAIAPGQAALALALKSAVRRTVQERAQQSHGRAGTERDSNGCPAASVALHCTGYKQTVPALGAHSPAHRATAAPGSARRSHGVPPALWLSPVLPCSASSSDSLDPVDG